MLDQGLAGPLDGRALGRELEPAVLALVAKLGVELYAQHHIGKMGEGD